MTKYRFGFLLRCAVILQFAELLNGQEVEPRIVGGSETTINRVPYMASLRRNGNHICGCSIINAKTVLTAAHCVRGRTASEFTVKVGSAQRNSGGVTVRVQSFTVHPKFTNNPLNFDIAALKLASTLVFSDTIKAIPIQTSPLPVGVSVTVNGWGLTSEGGQAADTLRSAIIETFSRDRCERIYGRGLGTAQFCAGRLAGGRDTCQGDSGGPLEYNGKLAGITSSGYGCARRGYPGMYTRIAYLLEFINAND